MSYLIDTNVLSELRRKQPDPHVVAWMQARPGSALFLSVLTLGKIREGTALQHDLTLVTRNTKDFAGLTVRLINPWEA